MEFDSGIRRAELPVDCFAAMIAIRIPDVDILP